MLDKKPFKTFTTFPHRGGTPEQLPDQSADKKYATHGPENFNPDQVIFEEDPLYGEAVEEKEFSPQQKGALTKKINHIRGLIDEEFGPKQDMSRKSYVEDQTSKNPESLENSLEQKALLRRILYRIKSQEIVRYGADSKTQEEISNLKQTNAEHFSGMHMTLHELWDLAEDNRDKSITSLDYRKVARYVNDHDIPENETGDLQHIKSPGEKAEEYAAAEQLAGPDKLGGRFDESYREYSLRSNPEARLAKALDVLEALTQMLFARRMDKYRYSSLEEIENDAGEYCRDFPTVERYYEYLLKLYSHKDLMTDFREEEHG